MMLRLMLLTALLSVAAWLAVPHVPTADPATLTAVATTALEIP